MNNDKKPQVYKFVCSISSPVTPGKIESITRAFTSKINRAHARNSAKYYLTKKYAILENQISSSKMLTKEERSRLEDCMKEIRSVLSVQNWERNTVEGGIPSRKYKRYLKFKEENETVFNLHEGSTS